MDTLLEKVKANLILEHSADDELLTQYITAAVSYAESYQHIAEGYYSENAMPATTEQATFTSQGTAPRAVSSPTTRTQRNRYGTRSTSSFGSTGIGRCDYEFRKDEYLHHYRGETAYHRQ